MHSKIDFNTNSKEDLYFFLKAVFSIVIYFALAYAFLILSTSEDNPGIERSVLFSYIGLIIAMIILRMGYFIGYLKGNAVKVNPSQFPDIAEIVSRQSEQLGLKNVPDVYILQSGGLLNALTSNFFGTNYIVLYSEIVESAYEQDKKILEFIIGHELGHIKQKHLLKKMLLLPSAIIPFLGAAYSRACEYTCDNIGHALCPEGAKNGLLLLATGRSLFKKVNTTEFIEQELTEAGFWKWFAEKLSSHPNLTKRVAQFKDSPKVSPVKTNIVLNPTTEDDYSKYMPKSPTDN